MKDKDCGLDNSRGVFYRQVEATVDADGTESIISEAVPFGDNPGATIDEFLHATGGRRLTDRERQAFYAFSANRWNSPWNPEGPKSNWRKPPKDPSAN